MQTLTTMNTPPSHVATSAKRKLRILYADDMRDLREVARISLTRDGHTIECVADGRLALEKVTANPQAYDLVITDHHMPMMNGLQLVNHLRALPYQGRIIVFCSELSEGVNHAYRALKVDHILYKPVFPSELRKLLAELEVSATAGTPAVAVAAT